MLGLAGGQGGREGGREERKEKKKKKKTQGFELESLTAFYLSFVLL